MTAGAPLDRLDLVIPGSIDQLTGGYLYARHVVAGLRARGVAVAVHELPGRFPDADDNARDAATATLAQLPDGAAVVIDGLALAGFSDCLAREAKRLDLLGLVHHPLAEETGLSEDEAQHFVKIERALLPLLRGVLCPSERTAKAVVAYGVDPVRVAIALPGTVKPRGAGTAPTLPSLRAGSLPPPQAAEGCDGALRAGSLPPPQAGEGRGGGGGGRDAGKPLRLLSVGTVTPRKGHRVLVAALARLVEQPWHLTIIGSLARDPATVAELRAAIAGHRLEDRIELAGEWPQERLSAAYAAADIFVLPSFHEGYGMVFAEALAFGLPIVATDAGAIPEVVPPDAALFVPAGDEPALAAALAQLMEDQPLRRRLALGAAAAGACLPSWNEAVEAWAGQAARLLA